MLDDFKEEQPIVYKILLNSLKKDRLSHAYLFELNGYSKGYDLALAFAKFLLCPNNYSNLTNCKNCNQCNNIDLANYLELKIINPDGQWIKKEQLEELQNEFIKKSIYGNKKIYIINQAERMNASASNSLLKFLEEPPENIIAILITDNMYQLLNTIISRCQIISFEKNNYSNKSNSVEIIANTLFKNNSEVEEFINKTGIKYIDTVIEYINFFEKRGTKTIAYKNKEFLEVFSDREKIKVAFNLFVMYYRDVLNRLLNLKCVYFNDYVDNIDKLLNKNTSESLSKKIKAIVDLSVNIKFNVNSSLLLDKLVIELSEV